MAKWQNGIMANWLEMSGASIRIRLSILANTRKMGNPATAIAAIAANNYKSPCWKRTIHAAFHSSLVTIRSIGQYIIYTHSY